MKHSVVEFYSADSKAQEVYCKINFLTRSNSINDDVIFELSEEYDCDIVRDGDLLEYGIAVNKNQILHVKIEKTDRLFEVCEWKLKSINPFGYGIDEGE